ncbi:hypothetical protein HDU97_002379 [Phlyctochytrium planicorne]|nr:hypothetical protein HDU97_002379 [Phlyctochytrium planicorne]
MDGWTLATVKSARNLVGLKAYVKRVFKRLTAAIEPLSTITKYRMKNWFSKNLYITSDSIEKYAQMRESTDTPSSGNGTDSAPA